MLLLFLSKGRIHVNTEMVGIFTGHVVRAISGICVGIMSYGISSWLEKKSFPSINGLLLSIIGTGALVSAFLIMILFRGIRIQPLVIALLFMGVSISCSGKASISTRYPTALCKFLGTWSLSLFLMHSSVRWALLLLARHNSRFQSLLSKQDTQSVLLVLAVFVLLGLLLGYLETVIYKPKGNRLPQNMTIKC